MSSAYQRKVSALATEIKALARSDGSYAPEDLIEWARKHPKSLLHASFEWSEKVAATEYRLEQARKLLRQYSVVVKGTVQEYGLISVISRRADSPKGSYLTQKTIAADKVLRKEVLEQCRVQLRGIKEKYGWLKELNSVWDVID